MTHSFPTRRCSDLNRFIDRMAMLATMAGAGALAALPARAQLPDWITARAPAAPPVDYLAVARAQIGRAHVRTPVTNAHLVCRLLLEKKNTKLIIHTRLLDTKNTLQSPLA